MSAPTAPSELIWRDVGPLDAFPEGEARAVGVLGKAVAVFHVDGQLFALQDRCSHGVGALSQGYVADGCVECPLHAALFDLRTGEVREGPAMRAVRSFSIRVRSSRVEIEA